jgi:hypothetical protein
VPKYVIERQYLLPIYQRLVVEADSVEDACRTALAHDDWSDSVEDNDGADVTTISAIKRIAEDIDPAEFDFDPEDPKSQNTHTLAGFLYGNDTSAIYSEVPEAFREDGA